MNRPIMRLYGAVVVLFVLLVAFTSRWTVFEAQGLRDNPFNHRALIQTLRIPRGDITAADGTLLARSTKDRSGLYVRHYPPAATQFAHVIGYSFARIGQAGLERSRNDALSGAESGVTSIIDQLSGKRRVGNDVVTTLDPRAQAVALNGLSGHRGAVVALDPRTGAVKVMASTPGYDPNSVDQPGAFTRLNADNVDKPLVNRATQFGPAPGSTFKIITATAALDSGQFSPSSTVSGKNDILISGVPLANDGNASYGVIDLSTALAQSVNTAWAQVAERVGKATLARYMERFGFDHDPPLDYPAGQMTPSGEYLRGRLLSPTSSLVDVGRMGIGQDKLSVTPLQMAMVASAVANGGTLMRPHLTDRIVAPDGQVAQRIAPQVFSHVMNPDTAIEVNRMMQGVVTNGTGTAAQIPGVAVAGKTGTSETAFGSVINDAWFIAFAPAEHPRIAVAVMVEKVPGFGGQFAAPIAKQVMEALLK